MPANRRPFVLAGILVVLLAILAWRQLGRGSSSAEVNAPAASSAATAATASPGDETAAEARTGRRAPGRGGTAKVPNVDLDRLTVARSEPGQAARNLFRFYQKPPLPPGARPPGLQQPAIPSPTPDPAVPLPPPPPPPIPLKLIGIVEGARGGKIAVLTDNANKGDTFYGQEGDVIDGRYRIVKIGVESVDMEYVDGRGRQPIRLSGE